MKVKKRDGTLTDVRFDEITDRIKNLCPGLENEIDPVIITKDITARIRDGITTSELDNLAAEICAVKAIQHPDYGKLSGRILVNDHQKNVKHNYPTFSTAMCYLYNNKDSNGIESPLISTELYNLVVGSNEELINQLVKHDRDFLIDYFGMKTLLKSYLLKRDDKVIETPQYMWLRVSLGIHGGDLHKAKITYDLMSQKYFTHASPTLFNSGTPHQQLSSCFVLSSEDSIEGIFKTITDCAKISKWAGGIGVSVSDIRSNGSTIRGTGGKSDGIVPMLKVYNDTARYINQGGRRNGSFAMYLEPWHPDIFEFLDCKKNHGPEETRARDLFYGLWVPDLFMERVRDNKMWSLMCPSQSPGLIKVYGKEFNNLYEKYELENNYIKRVPARDIWNAVINSQIETGMPYMTYKDHVNNKTNQKNLGTIRSSNLCAEINIYNDTEEYSVCNLSSIALPMFVDQHEQKFDFNKLMEVSQIITENLNKVIDINYYPTPETELSNKKHRPIGIGVQGLANVFIMMGMAFDSTDAALLNKQIFETIYYGSLYKSNQMAIEFGPYETFKQSPLSKGKFQFDLCKEFDNLPQDYQLTDPNLKWNWESLRTNIIKYGTRNSLLTALMPTASTSQILGFNECFEPFTSNIYKRRTLAGEFPLINKYLVYDLIKQGLWDKKMKYDLIENNGSVQNIDRIPTQIKNLYKTSWELKQRVLIDLSAQRSLYIDQSQSLNLFFEHPDFNLLQKAAFYGWKKGLKTGSYYIRSKPAIDAQSTTNTLDLEEEHDKDCLSCSA